MKNSKIISLVQIPLMTVIIVLCSWICLPLPVPITMQTFGIYAALTLLGGKKGLCSVLLYILLGAAGLPVFAGFSAGLYHLVSPTGGYIWGFVFCALFFLFTEKYAK
ncbi:MAG: biotin transporter BioY, partial [Ruminococcus sp.]|nr:biotin transporter BioY [Ruminococcus sp.]